MIPKVLDLLQQWNDPYMMMWVGIAFTIYYFIDFAIFNHHAQMQSYGGFWKKNGLYDVVSSVIWLPFTVILILSLIDLLCRNKMTLAYLLIYCALFIFLFAMLYSVISWHFPNSFRDKVSGWVGELQCVCMSLQAMTTIGFTAARPSHPFTEFLATVQALLGILFIAVFVAKAVPGFASVQ